MTEESQNNGQPFKQQSTVTASTRFSVEQEQARPERNNREPPQNSKSNSNRGSTSKGFNSFRSNNNTENYSERFDSRNSGGFGGRGRGGRYATDSDSRICYNCQKPGHISRNCPESRKETRIGDDRNVIFSSTMDGSSPSMLITISNSKNQNKDEQNDTNTTKPTFNSRQGHVASRTTNDNNVGNSHRPMIFYNSTMRGSFNNDNGSQVKNNRGGGGNNNSNKPDHQSPNTERHIPPLPPSTTVDLSDKAVVTKEDNFSKNQQTQFHCLPEGKIKPIESFQDANLNTQVVSNIRRTHFDEPTSIQRYIIPCIRQQVDIMACAQTGSGKTAAFLLPIISNLLEYHANELTEKYQTPSPFCLILSPTRELALRTEQEAKNFADQTTVIPCSAVGGLAIPAVSDRLQEGCHILSATTGRLKHMVESGRISLKRVKYFVLDEVDRMLDTGLEPDIRKLEKLGLPLKDKRFTFMFSTTFPDAIQKLAKDFLRENYILLTTDTPSSANEDIKQIIEEVSNANKKDRLFQLLEQNLKSERCLIFVETKRSVDYINSLLSQKKLMSTTIHDDQTPEQRNEVVKEFTNGKYPILVTTSVAARGLNFPLIGYVINYDLPDTSDFYIHRIGHLGKSISFFDPNRESDRKIASDLILKLTKAGQEVPKFLKQYANKSYDTVISKTVEENNEDEWEDEEEGD